MPINLASALVAFALAAVLVPPGYPAYIGAYCALAAALLALLVYGWRERDGFTHPSALAILAAIGLIVLTLPFTYRGSQDLLAPIFVLPMLSSIAIGLLARPARWVPSPTIFAALGLLGAAIAFAGGAYDHFILGIYRPGMGNNPIHFATMAAISGCLAMVGVAAIRSTWRYGFLLGPVLGIGAAVVSDSRGPMLGALAMTAVGMAVLLVWFWCDLLFRVAVLAAVALGVGAFLYLVGSGNARVASIADSALNIFRFTGGSDDIRAALYTSALEALRQSPIFGLGLGQIMQTAQAMFPQLPEVFTLEHLHADWANFVTMAGGMGLVAYILLLASPLLLLLDRRARADKPIVLGAILLTTGQFTLGVSNSMFGILPQTTIYAIALGYFLLRARRLEA